MVTSQLESSAQEPQSIEWIITISSQSNYEKYNEFNKNWDKIKHCHGNNTGF